MCVYGMEGPGGYQFVGRTLQMWNRYREVAAFDGKPWLLRFFDQIRFYPVSAEELTEWRRDFPTGRRAIRIEETTFRLAHYRAFLSQNAASIAGFEATRQAAFDAERAAWQASGEFDRVTDLLAEDTPGEAAAIELPEGTELIEAPFGGSVWKLMVGPGDKVAAGDVIAVIEAMKMECPLESPASGTIAALYIEERQSLQPGAPMLALRRSA
jgi:urea carboxylase